MLQPELNVEETLKGGIITMTVTLTASQIEVITDILCDALDEAQGGYRYDQIMDALNALSAIKEE